MHAVGDGCIALMQRGARRLPIKSPITIEHALEIYLY